MKKHPMQRTRSGHWIKPSKAHSTEQKQTTKGSRTNAKSEAQELIAEIEKEGWELYSTLKEEFYAGKVEDFSAQRHYVPQGDDMDINPEEGTTGYQRPNRLSVNLTFRRGTPGR